MLPKDLLNLLHPSRRLKSPVDKMNHRILHSTFSCTQRACTCADLSEWVCENGCLWIFMSVRDIQSASTCVHRLSSDVSRPQKRKCVCTHGPCGWFGGAGLLEGHLEGVRPGVVGVGGDGWCRRQALEGGVGLGVRWGGGHGGRRVVLGAVGAGGRRTAPQALHAAAQQVVLGLGGETKREENEKGGSRKTRGRTQVKVSERQGFGGLRKVGLQWKQICVNTVCDDASATFWEGVHERCMTWKLTTVPTLKVCV